MDDAVATWFAETSNPLSPVLRAIRDVIIEDEDISETVKYRAPCFEHDGIVCYFNWSSKKRASLIFPNGGSIPGEHPLLERGSNKQAMMYFDDLDDVQAKTDDLRNVISSYMAAR